MFSRKDLYVFTLLWITASIFFIDGWNAGWILDSIMHSYNVKDTSYSGYIQLHIDKTIRFVYHSAYYFLEKIFGQKGWDWYFFKISLHALNALLLYKVCEALLHCYSHYRNTKLPLLSAFLFLLAPTSADVVMYQAAFHFMLAFALLQMCLLLFLQQQEAYKRKYDILFYTFYLIALFTLEIAFVFSGIMLILVLLLPENGIKQKKLYLRKYVFVPLLMTLGYIALNYIVLHDFIGHYGTEKHFRFTLDRIVQNLSKIPLDLFGLIEYWDMNKMYKVYNILYEKQYIAGLAIVYLGMYGILVFKTYKNPVSNSIYFLLVNIIGCLALPTLSLGILYIIPVEEDRYYYTYAGFVYFLLLLVVYKYAPKMSYAFVFILCLLGAICLQKNITGAAVAQSIIDTSLVDFPYKPGKRYMVLAMPVYSNGVLVWDTHESRNDPFEEDWQLMEKALYVKRNIDVRGKIASVLQFNVLNDKESPILEVLDSNTIRMTLPCCGKWWWKHNVGALPYENDYYKVAMIGGWQQEVKISFKQQPADMVYLYQCGNQFCEWQW